MAKVRVTSPKGELNWVFISGEGSYNELSDKYEYKTTVTCPIDDPSAQAFKQKIDDLWANSAEKKKYDEAFEQSKPAVQAKFEFHPGYTIDVDDHGQELGTISFRFKTNTTFETKKGLQDAKVQVYNAHAQKVDIGDIKIGNGTIGRASGTAMSWFKGQGGGVSLYLSSIQVIKLVEYVDNEFGEEEDGDFVAPDNSQNEFTSMPETDEQSAPDVGV